MSRASLSAQDWTRAALGALAAGGVAAVRVDVLARRMGITRGSFYWHFKDREALLLAAMEEWERVCTTDMIASLDRIPDPAERMRTLFAHAVDLQEMNGLEPAIAAHSDHPVIAPVLRRVTERRIDFLTRIYTDLGLTAPAARRQAVVAYAAYVGWLSLRRAALDSVPEVTGQGPVAQAAQAHLVAGLVAAGS